MEERLKRRPAATATPRDSQYDFGWTPKRASQLTSTPLPTCTSPARQEERERRRRRRRSSGDRERDGSGRRTRAGGRGGGAEDCRRTLPTDYRGALARHPPPIPSALIKKVGTREVQGLGKVRVVLRVSASVAAVEGETEVLTLDKRKRQVTLLEPPTRQPPETRLGVAAPKMFAFDQVYTREDPQSEVVSGAVVDVLHAVLAGNDGCVLCFGGGGLGKTLTMLGPHTAGPDHLGVMPSAVAWLYRAIVELKAKTGARFSVRVSAVAVDAAGDALTDLLAEYAQEGEASPGALLRDTTGGYLSSVAELRAPSPEAAAHYLDVAVAGRSARGHSHQQSGQPTQSPQQAPPLSGAATLLYTLHIYQYAVDKSGKGGVVGGRSRLHMIDMGDLSGSGGGLSLSALTSVLLAIFNGQRYLPHRENRLTLLLKEALGSVTCHAAMVVHVSPAPRHVQHSLATLQLASRVHRMRRKKLKGFGGSGSGGSSEGSQSRSGSNTSAGSSSMDFSSSEQSCDTVIYIGGGGPGDTSDNEHPPVFMPHHTNQQLWPIARLRSMEHLRPHSASPTPAHSRRAASASPTPTSRSMPNGRPQVKPRPPPRTVSSASSGGGAGRVTPGGGFIRHQPGVSRIAYTSSSTQQPLLSSFKPQVALGPLVPGDLRHFNYNAYEEPNNLVPIFPHSRIPVATQQLQNQRQVDQHHQQQVMLQQQRHPQQQTGLQQQPNPQLQPAGVPHQLTRQQFHQFQQFQQHNQKFIQQQQLQLQLQLHPQKQPQLKQPVQSQQQQVQQQRQPMQQNPQLQQQQHPQLQQQQQHPQLQQLQQHPQLQQQHPQVQQQQQHPQVQQQQQHSQLQQLQQHPQLQQQQQHPQLQQQQQHPQLQKMQQHSQLHQQQQHAQLQQQQQQVLLQQQGHLSMKGVVDGVISDEQWIDGPRMHKSRVAAGQKMKTNKAETWVDGPQVGITPISYGFMDDHKKTMIERWVAVQTAQVVQQLEQQQTVPAQTPVQTAVNTQQQFTHLTQFRTCEESTLDSDQDTLSEDPPSGPGRPMSKDESLPPEPNLIEELERKNLIPAEDSTENAEVSASLQSETDVSKEPTTDEKSTEPQSADEKSTEPQSADEKSTEPHSPDEVSVAEEPSIDDICSQCEALAEECEELSSLLSCEEEECKRQAHLGLATVLEEPELEAAIIAEDQHKVQEAAGLGSEEVHQEEAVTPRRGWVRRSLASSGTHHSTELIEVHVPDYPVITTDCCLQVCEEDIIRALADTPCPSDVMSVETSDDHPLRVLSEENLTCASTFTDSYSQIGETGDEDDSDDDDSRPFSLFEVTDYGRVCQDLSLALRSDVANRNLHELAKIHDLYRTLARQSPRVHTGGPRLQAATLAEILTNSHDSLLEDQKPPLEDDSICSEPAQAEEKLCRHCNKKQLRHGDSILRLESALRSKSQWLSRPLEILEDSASDKCIGTDDVDLPEDHCTCDVQSDLVPYIPSMFFKFSSIHTPIDMAHQSITRQASEASLHLGDAPLADSTEKLIERVPMNGMSLPEFIEDMEANVVLCNPVQYDYSKDDELIDGNDERTVTGKSDNESDCVSNISEDSEYMMQTSKLSKFLCVGVGKSKSKTPYKVAKQNNNKIIENKKNIAKIKETKVKTPVKSRENSKSPDRNSKNLIKSPSRVVSQSAAKQSVSRRGDSTSAVRTRWGKSARVGVAKPPAAASRGNYRYTCTLMYPPDAPTPTEGYDSGHDSGATTQGCATPLENPETWRTGQNLPSHPHHHHPAANSGSLGTNPSLGESSGYESIPRDSECSSFSSSQDSEMDEEHRREAQAAQSQGLAQTHHGQPRPQAPPGPSTQLQVEQWSEEDVKRYEGRPRATEMPELRAHRQQILSIKATQRSLKADLAQAKGNLNVPANSWSYERKSNYM